MVVNEGLGGGWLEFLTRVEFDEMRSFDAKREQARLVPGSAKKRQLQQEKEGGQERKKGKKEAKHRYRQPSRQQQAKLEDEQRRNSPLPQNQQGSTATNARVAARLRREKQGPPEELRRGKQGPPEEKQTQWQRAAMKRRAEQQPTAIIKKRKRAMVKQQVWDVSANDSGIADRPIGGGMKFDPLAQAGDAAASADAGTGDGDAGELVTSMGDKQVAETVVNLTVDDEVGAGVGSRKKPRVDEGAQLK